MYVCTDVTRHAAEADAGVPAQFLTPPEDAKHARAERRAQKKAWRESHAPRRAVLADALATMSAGAAMSRVAGAFSIRELDRPALAERPQWESDEPVADGETDAGTCDQLAAGSNSVDPAGVKALIRRIGWSGGIRTVRGEGGQHRRLRIGGATHAGSPD